MCSTPPAGTTLSKSCSILYKGANAASLVWGFYRNANFPVPNFGNVFYGKDNTGLAGCGATIGGATRTIKSASATVHEYQMVSSTNQVLVKPSSLSTDGTSFSETFLHAGP